MKRWKRPGVGAWLGLAVILWGMAGSAYGQADWQSALTDTFDRAGLGEDWLTVGDWTIEQGAATVDGAPGTELRWTKTLTQPAIRVSMEIWSADEKAANVALLLGVGPGGEANAGAFVLGAEGNTCAKLLVPAKPPLLVEGLTLKPGQHHQVVAEANGTVLSFTVDGKLVAQRQAAKPLDAGQIVLTVGAGKLFLGHVEVRTKDEADPAEKVLIKTVVAPKEEAYIPPRWDPTALQMRSRPPRVANQKVAVKVRSVIASDQPKPVTFAVPLPEREIYNANNMKITDASGNELPAQFTPLATWEQNDSLRWVQVDTQMPLAGEDQPVDCTLEYGRGVFPRPVDDGITIEQTDDAITVSTGPLKVRFAKNRGSLIDQLWYAGKELMPASPRRGAFYIDNKGQRCQPREKDPGYALTVEHVGPMRVVIRAEGWYADAAGRRACRFVTRVHLYRNQATMRIVHTWVNTEDTDKTWFQDVGLDLPMAIPGAAKVLVGKDDRQPELLQEAALDGKPVTALQRRLRQYVVRQADKDVAAGRRLSGWISILGEKVGVTLGVRDMGMQHPASLEAGPDGLTFLAWSSGAGFPLDFRHAAIKALWGDEAWQRLSDTSTRWGPLEARVSNGLGLARTHDLQLTFHDPHPEAAQIAGVLSQNEPLAIADPDWNCNSGALELDIAPYEPTRHGIFERQISEQMTRYQDVARSLNPYVGFWDYGRGCPSFTTQRTAAGNEPEWAYNGERANADLSYGNPMSAWLLYLRSGERRYWNLARAMTTQMFDTRIIHWHSADLGREIGQNYSEQGAWSFDGRDAGWRGGVWPSALPLAFYFTGDQRPLDVFCDVVGGYLHSHRKPADNESVVYLGAIAQMRRLSWEPELLTQLEDLVPPFLQRQTATGFWPDRDAWYEYALLHLLAMPTAKQTWVDTGLRFAHGAIGSMRFHTAWGAAAGIQAWAFKREKDILYAVNAREAVKLGVPPLTGATGLAPLRSTLVWLRLKDTPGVDDYIAPRVFTYVRPHETPFYFQHDAGRETYLELHYRQGEVVITDILNNTPISPLRLRSQRQIGIYEIRLPASEPMQQYRIQCKLPTLYEAEEGAKLGRSLPWRPSENELLVVMHDPVKFVQDISGGRLTQQEGPIYFSVNARTEKLRVTGPDNWPATNELALGKAGGPQRKFDGYEAELTLSAAQRDGIWSAAAKFPYAVLSRAALARGPLEPRFFRLDGVAPFVSPQPDTLFLPGAAADDDGKREPVADLQYPRGKFRRGIRLSGASAYLQIPTGASTDDPAVRQFFNARQGTLEMYIQFDRRGIEGGYDGRLIVVPQSTDRHPFLEFTAAAKWDGYLNGAGNRQNRIPLLSADCTPSIAPGTWCHLAIQWNTNDNGRTMRRVYLDGYPYPYGDAYGSEDLREAWPLSLEPGTLADAIFLGDDGQSQRSRSAIAIDELRISDVQRYPFMPGPPKVGGRRAFTPPEEPFEPDGRTLALFHFEGNVTGSDAQGNAIDARRIAHNVGDIPGK
ncbi:MAG: hypothetical protein IT440_06595 [Phycisphaeraceae bacterium]|nr:hypothetical protein [Phycisphaeraceae bacterium]